MNYASIDLETTGLDPHWCQILEIGLVIDDLDEPLKVQHISPTPNYFHAYIKHEQIKGQPYALMLNAEIIKIIAEGKHPSLMTLDEAEDRMNAFLKLHFEKKVTAAGKNFQGFDKPFLANAFGEKAFNFHHRCFDATTNFYRKGDKQLPDLKLCLERAGIDLPFKLHTAIDDAKAVIALLRSIHCKV